MRKERTRKRPHRCSGSETTLESTHQGPYNEHLEKIRQVGSWLIARFLNGYLIGQRDVNR